MNKTQKTEKSLINIWIVEDNTRYRKTLVGLVNAAEDLHCSGAFSSCEEAFNHTGSSEPPLVILLDIGLPGISGIDGIEKFKSIFPNTLIIILTIYEDNEKVFNALCAGASGYLLKDSTPDKIIESISEVIAGGAPMNMKIAHKVLEIFAKIKKIKSDYGLTDREKEILQAMVEGLTKQQIAEKLFLSFHTVNTHIKNIYIKLHVNTLSAAVSKVYKENLL